MLIDKIEELNSKLYRAFGDLKEHAGHLGDKKTEVVGNYLMELYERDFELIRGTLTETDVEIGNLKNARTKALMGVKAEEKKLEQEEQIQADVIEEQFAIRRAQLVPADLPKRWWQRFARPNKAKELAVNEAILEVRDYFGEREARLRVKAEQQAGEVSSQAEAIYGELLSLFKKPRFRGVKAEVKRAEWIEALHKKAETIAVAISRRESAEKAINQEEPATDEPEQEPGGEETDPE